MSAEGKTGRGTAEIAKGCSRAAVYIKKLGNIKIFGKN